MSIFWVWRQPFKSLMDKQKVFLSQTDPSSSVASVMELWWLVDAKFSSDQQCNVSPADVIFFQHFIFFFFFITIQKAHHYRMRKHEVKISEGKKNRSGVQPNIYTHTSTVCACLQNAGFRYLGMSDCTVKTLLLHQIWRQHGAHLYDPSVRTCSYSMCHTLPSLKRGGLIKYERSRFYEVQLIEKKNKKQKNWALINFVNISTGMFLWGICVE